MLCVVGCDTECSMCNTQGAGKCDSANHCSARFTLNTDLNTCERENSTTLFTLTVCVATLQSRRRYTYHGQTWRTQSQTLSVNKANLPPTLMVYLHWAEPGKELEINGLYETLWNLSQYTLTRTGNVTCSSGSGSTGVNEP